jgi:hypothetical protein
MAMYGTPRLSIKVEPGRCPFLVWTERYSLKLLPHRTNISSLGIEKPNILIG